VNPTAQDEITAYVEGVRAALVGLPEATRQELLEDLPEHLAEVRAEGQGTLIERLGTPAAYAAELRATAGFVGGFPDPPASTWVPLSEVRDNALRLLRRADDRVGPVLGYPKASDFLVLLRPAWWVLRGYLVAMALAFLLEGNRNRGLLPRLGGSFLVALVLLAGCVLLSITLGRRSAELKPLPKFALWSGTVFLAIFALSGFVSADINVRNPDYQDAGSYDANPYSNVNDVFVYDNTGKLVIGARLFDQDGTPIQLGSAWCNDPSTGESVHTRTMGYPYCPENAPFTSPSAAQREPVSSLSPSGPLPSGPLPSGPLPSGPLPSGPLPSGPAPSGPPSLLAPASPVQSGPPPSPSR
jgi:hypothetical protein